MSQHGGYLQRYAMLFGTYMGVFWILKFILLPLTPFVPFLLFLFNGLTFLVPFVGFYYARMYRSQGCGGAISFVHAWLFTVFMYMFAALLTTVAHYVYFQFVDQGHLLQFTLTTINEGVKTSPKEMQPDFDLIKEMAEVFFSQSAIDITVNIMSSNVIYGSLLAIPTALFVMKKGKPTEMDSQS